jgi:HEAT repeat protein
MPMLVLSFSSTPPTQHTWFWAVADIVVGALVLLNLLVLVFIHIRRVRERTRTIRAGRFRQRFELILAEIESAQPDERRLQRQLAGLNELERPIAQEMLIGEIRESPDERRERIRDVLRRIGAIEQMRRSLRRRIAWRRALAARTLGIVGAEEAVSDLLERLGDSNRYVREAAVRALGRIGDPRALRALGELFAAPGQVAPGLVYEALVSFGEGSAQAFREGLWSKDVHVRLAAVYGCAAVLEPETARSSLERMLADEAGAVRAAAAQLLGRLGGASVPESLRRASRDEQRSVRRAAVSALQSYDDPQAVRLALGALSDPDRDTAIRAGEVLVELERRGLVSDETIAAATDTSDPWPLEQARIVAALERR